MYIEDELEFSYQLLKKVIKGNHCDDNTLVRLCDELDFSNNTIEHLLNIDYEYLKSVREENNG